MLKYNFIYILFIGDNETKSLGIIAILSDHDGIQEPMMLEYKAVQDSTNETTVAEIWKCLNKYGLTETFKAGKIAVSCDGGMEPAIRSMFANSLVTPEINICIVHSCKLI